jgi:hypothetical protein
MNRRRSVNTISQTRQLEDTDGLGGFVQASAGHIMEGGRLIGGYTILLA